MVKKIRMVCGVGVNDADYPVHKTEMVGGRWKITWKCPVYGAWKRMLERAYSEKYHGHQPTYIECSVTPEWRSFSAFRSWMIRQDYEGGELDKDILIRGNKVYSPNKCVFVSRRLNSFLLDCGSSRGEWPLGVSWRKANGEFQTQCSNPFTGKVEYLGYFTCPNAAHEAWRAKKHQHALRYADMQSDQRIADALRTRYAKKPEGETA